MPDIKSLYQDALAGRSLVVVPEHTKWMELVEEEQVYSDEARSHCDDVLAGRRKRVRIGRISASALGRCPREALFTFHGAPKTPFNLDSFEMMAHGSWDHLRWQMEGITMGWIREKSHAEMFMMDLVYPVGGSLDALMYDDSVFELKTCNSFIYKNVVKILRRPTEEARLQAGCYMRMVDADAASVVYEHRDSGKYHEFRMLRDDRLEADVERYMAALSDHVAAGSLPAMLPDCRVRRGSTFNGCQYRNHCPTVNDRNEPLE